MSDETVIRACLVDHSKEKASETLEQTGLTVPDLTRLLLSRIAANESLPFDIRDPNATTRKAFADVERGKIIRHKTNKGAFEDLGL